MKGIILAGGTGSRLFPLTSVTNKHLLPIGKKPMVLHSVNKLVEVGITKIMVVTGTEHAGGMMSLLGSGNEYGCNFTYAVQDQPNGIAGALLLCEDFVGSDDVIVILGDNIFEDSLHSAVNRFNFLKVENKKNIPLCLLALKQVQDPERFGVAEVRNNKIVCIEEKPELPKSNSCVTGVYVYDKNVFTYIKDLSVSERNEYEISEVNNQYIKNGIAAHIKLVGWWTDAGTHESYFKANELVNERKNARS